MRAIQVTKVTEETAEVAIPLVKPPPEPWFVRGPRGGLYVATGPVEGPIVGHEGYDFMTGTISVAYRSKSARYVRPSSRLAKSANLRKD